MIVTAKASEYPSSTRGNYRTCVVFVSTRNLTLLPKQPQAVHARLVKCCHDVLVRQEGDSGSGHRANHVGAHACVKRPPALLLHDSLKGLHDAVVLELGPFRGCLARAPIADRHAHALQEALAGHWPSLRLHARTDDLVRIRCAAGEDLGHDAGGEHTKPVCALRVGVGRVVVRMTVLVFERGRRAQWLACKLLLQNLVDGNVNCDVGEAKKGRAEARVERPDALRGVHFAGRVES
jgi:hypothetical protein